MHPTRVGGQFYISMMKIMRKIAPKPLLDASVFI